MDLSIIIVNWNTRELLAQCLRAVYETVHDISYEVIVVDNASADGSAAMVREQFPWVKLIESQENLGFARGNNVALGYASGKHILLLNPDTVAQECAINRLYNTLQRYPRLGAVGAQLLNPDGSEQESWGIFPSLWTELPMLNRWLRGAPQLLAAEEPASPLVVDWVSGASLMMRRQTLEQVGKLDESYWLYTEEADWCYRARKAGLEIALVPSAQVTHVARAASRQRLAETMIHYYRSRLRFIVKYHGTLQGIGSRLIFTCKAALWAISPARSPLIRAMPDLPLADVRRAYGVLCRWGSGFGVKA